MRVVFMVQKRGKSNMCGSNVTIPFHTIPYHIDIVVLHYHTIRGKKNRHQSVYEATNRSNIILTSYSIYYSPHFVYLLYVCIRIIILCEL